MNFIKRTDYQELQSQPFEKFHGIAAVGIIRLVKGFIDNHKPEGAVNQAVPAYAVLVTDRRGQDSVSQFCFLTAGFAAGVVIKVFFPVIPAITFGSGKLQPVTDIDHFAGPVFLIVKPVNDYPKQAGENK